MRQAFVTLMCALGLLCGCGTTSFANGVAVVVSTPQRVSVFDPEMGRSAEWAGQWLEAAAPGQPYTREVPAIDTKFIGDSSPPGSVRIGVYLPDLTDTGYYALTLNDAAVGVTQRDLPFVAWYSSQPVTASPPLPVTVDLASGPNGWLITITARTGA